MVLQEKWNLQRIISRLILSVSCWKVMKPLWRIFLLHSKFRVSYQLHENSLKTTYHILNTSDHDIYFSVAGIRHLNYLLQKEPHIVIINLEFDKNENLGLRWPISAGGLIEKNPIPFLENTKILPLNKELFLQDALVFKHPASSSVSLRSKKTTHGLNFDFPGFPYLGIWAAKNADFVCIEPWCGIADSVDADQQLIHKEGIIQLETGKEFERSWEVRLFDVRMC